MSDLFPIPFDEGFGQDVDPAVNQHGTLFRIQNGRIPRAGGIAPRYGTVELSKTVSPTSQAFGSGLPHAAGTIIGKDVLALSGRAYARDTAASVPPTWQEVGRPAAYLPRKGHWLALNQTQDVDSPPHLATDGSTICTVYTASGNVNILLTDLSGVHRFQAIVTGEVARVLKVGLVYVITYESGADTLARTLDPSTLSLSGSTVILTRQTANDRYDAAEFSGTQFLVCFRSNTTTWTVALINLSGFGTAASRNITVANQVHAYERVYCGSTFENVYAAFYDSGATGTVAVLPTSLASHATNAFGTNGARHPSFTRRNSTSSWLMWVDLAGGGIADEVALAQVDNGANVATQTDAFYGLVLASCPFDGTADRVRVWVHSLAEPVTGRAPFADRYTLVTISQGASGQYMMQPELTSDQRASLDHGAPTSGKKSAGPVAIPNGGERRYAGITTDTGATVGGFTSLQMLEFEDTSTQRGAWRQLAAPAGAGALIGGHLQEMTFGRVNVIFPATEPRGFENGFMRDPALTTFSQNAAGGSFPAGVYQAVAVYEYVDTAGRIHYSAPSASRTVTLNLNDQVDFAALTNLYTEREASALSQASVLAFYMTVAGGSTFYRMPNDIAATSTSVTVGFTANDPPNTGLGARLLYTRGGRFANRPAPSCRFGMVSHDRLWLCGLWDPRMIECSKGFVIGEPVQFTRADQFRALAPFDVIALAELDDQILVIGREGLAIMSAEGPNDQGNPPLLSPTLLSNTGCVDERSVIRIPAGIVMQTKRGFMLVPRGGGEPEFIGAPIQADVDLVFSAAEAFEKGSDDATIRAVQPSRLVAFSVSRPPVDSSVRTFVFDQDTMKWVSEDSLSAAALGSIGVGQSSRLVHLPFDAANNDVLIASSTPGDDGAHVILEIETNVCRPFGLLGWGYVRVLQLALTVLEATNSTIRLEVAKDGGAFVQHPVDAAVPAVGTRVVEWQIAGDQPVNSIKFRVSCRSTSGARRAAILHGLTAEVDRVAGLVRLPTTQRV